MRKVKNPLSTTSTDSELQQLKTDELLRDKELGSQEWSEALPYPPRNKRLLLDARKFQAWHDATCAELGVDTSVKEFHMGGRTVDFLDVPYVYMHETGIFSLYGGRPRATRGLLGVYRHSKPWCNVTFTDTVRILRLHNKDTMIMSLTPSEIMSLRAAYRFCRGRVLVGGLGLGWLPRRIAQMDKVSSVTVCETHEATAYRFGNKLVKDFAGKAMVEVSDFYSRAHALLDDGKQLSIIGDIWYDIGDHKYDRKWDELVERVRGLKEKGQKLSIWAW